MPMPQSTGFSLTRLFAYPFRIFFLSVGIWAFLSVPLWLGMLTGSIDLPLAMPALYWHQHEMLFGFLNPAIAGFLLTAVCVWTQTDRIHGSPLFVLWLIWLAGRVFCTLGAQLPVWLVNGVDLAFLPLVMLDAGYRIWYPRQSRQLVILVMLGLLWSMQAGFVLAPGFSFAAGALITATALMLVVGGRITPAFSGNWLRMQGGNPDAIRVHPGLEKLLLASMALLLAAVLLDFKPVVTVIAPIAGAASLLRLWLWRGWRVRSEPLLWILHLSLLWIPVALFLLAGGAAGWIPSTAWVHAAAVGAMGGLILGVMSRVALGHTGRPLILPAGMVTAFALVQAAAGLRLLTAVQIFPWRPGILISGGCWIAAFAIFVWRYAPILARPRADGQPG
ncbi:MAG: NnrS family protein [Methylohalobius crimeensis]